MNSLEIQITAWDKASQHAFPIRKTVFIEEQGVPEDLEIDELDATATHLLAFWGGQCVGTARLVTLGRREAQIGRMAVLDHFRGRGIGMRILEALIHLANSRGISSLILHAQLRAIPFYEKLGFIAQGPIYEEAGIAHRNMMLTLSN